MQFTNLDSITRRWLLERRLSIHFYAEGLTHAATCLRELSLKGLTVLNSKNLPVNSYGAFDLPHDFQDDIGVCIQSGQRLVGLPVQNSISPLRLRDTAGNFVPYASQPDNVTDGFGYPAMWNWYWNVNDYGEPTGRQFGSGGGTQLGYKIFKERKQGQMTENFADSNIVLLYISNGQSFDNASQIDWYAFSTIQSYMDWASSPYSMDKDSAPARKYYNELSGLAYGMHGMGVEDIKNTVRQASSGFIKN